jgi:hypothetical protein
MILKKFLGLVFVFIFFVNIVNAQTFVDVNKKDWFYPYTEDLVKRGIIDANLYFHPQDFLTRAELVKIMVLASTGVIDDQIPDNSSFQDVNKKDWFYPYVETAKITGIIKGYPDNTFKPNQKIIRAEAVKVIVNTLGLPKNEIKEVRFRDYDKKEWFHIYVKSAYNAEIVTGLKNKQGYPQMIFEPSRGVLRSEMAKMLSKAFKVSSFYENN